MSIDEVAGEPTTSGAINPKYKIPKKKALETNKLNDLASNISPPAKEKKKETSEPTQPHKNKKGRQYGHISGTRWSRGGRRK